MLTPQDVADRTFPKMIVGGYNMVEVDKFMDELTDDYTTLYRENAVLKEKMKILVDKVSEYRETEDAMRSTLLSAQKLANSMVEEATQKKQDILDAAEDEARQKVFFLQEEFDRESRRLADAKAETAKFMSKLGAVFKQEMQALQLIVADVPRSREEVEAERSEIEEIDARLAAGFPPHAPLETENVPAAENNDAGQDGGFPSADGFASTDP